MTRAYFIKSILFAAGASALPATWLKVYDKFYLLQSFIAGFQYHQGMGLLGQIKEGDLLQLKREPENPHDAQAIALLWNEKMIGYVPADLNEILSRLIDADALQLHCEITHVKSHAASWENIAIAIYFLKERMIGEKVPVESKYLTQLQTPEYFSIGSQSASVTRIQSSNDQQRIVINADNLPARFTVLKEKYEMEESAMNAERFYEPGIRILEDIDIEKLISEIEKAVEKVDSFGQEFVELFLKKK